jgi:uncharacterized surface protein with fasciclin (FAS1) repeats
MTIVNLRKIQVEFLSRDETRATHPSYPTQQPGVPYRNSEFIQSLTVQYTMATSCYSNAYEIYSAVAFNNVKNVTICPGTTFTVGAPADDEFTGFSGGFPILIDQPDVEVFCGFPSSSKNACVLDGGFHQLLVGNPASDTDNCDNLLVHGLTFTGTLENALGGFASAVYATAAASNVVLDDCIFKDTTYDGFAVMVESDSTVEITIQNTVFENIDYGYGMLFGNDMTMNLNDVTFDNVKHVPSAESNGAVYFSNIIWGPGPASAFVDVTIKNSNYYTAALATTWNSVDSFNVNIPSPDPLITLIDTDVLVDPNDSREPNISFCGGGWAADYNITDNTFECFRLTTNVDFFDFLDCGVNCNEWDEYTYFRDVLIATGLFDTLSEADYDEVTVFVPDNGAFDDIPDGYIEALIENDMDTLIEIVKYHITKDIVYTASIELGYGSSETILEGESVSYSLPVAPRNQFLVNGAAIIKADLEEKPGSGKLIQVIDKILIPPTVTLNPGIADILVDLSLNIVIVAAYAEYEPQLDPSKTYSELPVPKPSCSVFLPMSVPTDNFSPAHQLLHSPACSKQCRTRC